MSSKDEPAHNTFAIQSGERERDRERERESGRDILELIFHYYFSCSNHSDRSMKKLVLH
jgi:hypothetical protein